jgi:hypothetical protein
MRSAAIELYPLLILLQHVASSETHHTTILPLLLWYNVNECRCHCTGLDPSAYITTQFKKLTGTELTSNKVWSSKNQPPGDPSNPDCSSKTAFNIAGIYGDVGTVS